MAKDKRYVMTIVWDGEVSETILLPTHDRADKAFQRWFSWWQVQAWGGGLRQNLTDKEIRASSWHYLVSRMLEEDIDINVYLAPIDYTARPVRKENSIG